MHTHELQATLTPTRSCASTAATQNQCNVQQHGDGLKHGWQGDPKTHRALQMIHAPLKTQSLVNSTTENLASREEHYREEQQKVVCESYLRVQDG